MSKVKSQKNKKIMTVRDSGVKLPPRIDLEAVLNQEDLLEFSGTVSEKPKPGLLKVSVPRENFAHLQGSSSSLVRTEEMPFTLRLANVEFPHEGDAIVTYEVLE